MSIALRLVLLCLLALTVVWEGPSAQPLSTPTDSTAATSSSLPPTHSFSSPDAPKLGKSPAVPHQSPVAIGPNGSPATAPSPRGVPPKALEVWKAVQDHHGNPLPGYVGGRAFENRERRLPPGRYREYDIHPKIPGRNRGPERLVIEQRSLKAYYSGDHYRTFIPLN